MEIRTPVIEVLRTNVATKAQAPSLLQALHRELPCCTINIDLRDHVKVLFISYFLFQPTTPRPVRGSGRRGVFTTSSDAQARWYYERSGVGDQQESLKLSSALLYSPVALPRY